MTCLSENTIVAFLQGRSAAAARVEAHIDTCAPCRALVSDVAKTSLPPTLVDGAPIVNAAARGEDDLLDSVLAGRFRLLERLGRGAMGTVYRARDLVLQVDVAIKVLHPVYSDNPDYIRQLHGEILTGRRISHPNVRRIFDLGKAQRRYFLSMQYLEAQTLTRVLSQKALSPEQSLAIIEQVCAALAAAHREGVVHRDLKPSNVMIDAAYHVTVVDFGLAVDLARSRERAGVVAGTPSHWSPEQSRGEPATVRSDVFSLGVLSCDLLCGESRGVESASLLAKVPRPMRAFVRRCLAQDPAQRFADAAEAAAALPRLRRRRQHGRALAAGLAVGVGLGWFLWSSRSAPSPATATAEVATAAARDPLRVDLIPAPAETSCSRGDTNVPQRANCSAPHPHSPQPPRPPSTELRAGRVGRGGEETATRGHDANPAPQGTTSTSVSTPTMAAPAFDVTAEIDALEQLRRRLELLPSDMAAYASLLQDSTAAIPVDAPALLRQARRELIDTRIDESFVRRKLERLAQVASRDARVPDLLTRVHESYFAGRYREANSFLNELASVVGHER